MTPDLANNYGYNAIQIEIESCETLTSSEPAFRALVMTIRGKLADTCPTAPMAERLAGGPAE